MVRGGNDEYFIAVCNKTGSISIYNNSRNLFLSPFADGPINFNVNPDGTMNVKNISRFGRSFSILRIPYTLKLLIQELEAMNVHMRIITDENVDQLLGMSYSDNINKLLKTEKTNLTEVIDEYTDEINKILRKTPSETLPRVNERPEIPSPIVEHVVTPQYDYSVSPAYDPSNTPTPNSPNDYIPGGPENNSNELKLPMTSLNTQNIQPNLLQSVLQQKSPDFTAQTTQLEPTQGKFILKNLEQIQQPKIPQEEQSILNVEPEPNTETEVEEANNEKNTPSSEKKITFNVPETQQENTQGSSEIKKINL